MESTPKDTIEAKCELKNGSKSNFKTPKGKEVVYFRCGQSGHMSYECPTKNNLHFGIKENKEIQETNDGYIFYEDDFAYSERVPLFY